MTTPPSRRRTARPADPASEAPVPVRTTGARRAVRGRRPEKKKAPVVPIAIGGGVLVLGVILFFVFKSRGEEAPTVPPQTATAPALEPAPPPKPVEPAAPPKPPPPTAASIDKKLAAATTAAEAKAAAREAAQISEAALEEKCWTRVLELDEEDADARTQLDVRRIQTSTDLPGYDALASTPHRVHLDALLRESKHEMTRAQRAEVVARWESMRPSLEERATKARTDPFFREVDELRLDLKQKKFFDSLEYEMVECPPYALFIEVEGTPEERQQRRQDAETAYVPFLKAYDAKIRSYLVPLAPKPLEKDPLFPVFVFLRVERYRDYAMAETGHPPSPGMRAHYESWKKHSFTYSPVLKPGLGAFQEGTQSLLHEITHAWVDQLASSDGGRTRTIATLTSHWFSEGIAEYMSCQFMHQNQIRFQPWRSNRVSGQFRPPGWRIDVRSALSIPMHGLDAWAVLQVPELSGEKRDAAIATISSGFYADMSNFILWLNLKSGANRPAQFEAYAREELAGRGGLDAFKKCVPGLLEEFPDLDATIDDFVKRIANGKINPYKEFEEAKTKPANAAE